jgi:hypothetical protein
VAPQVSPPPRAAGDEAAATEGGERRGGTEPGAPISHEAGEHCDGTAIRVAAALADHLQLRVRGGNGSVAADFEIDVTEPYAGPCLNVFWVEAAGECGLRGEAHAVVSRKG